MARVLPFLLGTLVVWPLSGRALMDSEYNYVAAKNEAVPTHLNAAFNGHNDGGRWTSYCLPQSLPKYVLRLKEKAALGICPPEDDYSVPEIYEEEQTEAEPQAMPEVESESPTGPFEIPDTERYVVKAVPMTSIPAASSTTEKQMDDSMPSSEEVADNTNQQTEVEIEEAGPANETRIEEEEKSETIEKKNKTEPDIPSFREWTQKALEEEQKKREEEKREKEQKKKQNGNGERSGENSTVLASEGGQSSHAHHAIPVHLARLKKNFASLDCGAKIAAANAEAQSALNIITSSRDEYMLNKCSDKVWFVVELCESIKAFKIEFANFELYSSVPKDIRITMGNVLPGRDKDWGLFGNFEAEDIRSVQTFVSPEGVFGKYVKVEINSFHGSEHYCPVSMFKIYGISEIELIGAEDDDEEEESPEDNDVIAESPPSLTTLNDSNSVFKMLKETFKRIAGVFAPSMQIKDLDMALALNQTSLVGNTFNYDIICPGCDDNRIRDVYYLLASNFQQLSRTLKSNVNLRAALSAHVCQSYGFNIHKSIDDICSGIRMIEFYATLFGTSRIMALCNVIGIEAGLWKKADSHLVLPPFRTTKASETISNTSATLEEQNNVTQSSSSDLPPEIISASEEATVIESSKSSSSFSKASVSVTQLTKSIIHAPKKQVTNHEQVASSEKIVVAPSPVTSTASEEAAAETASIDNSKIEPTPASRKTPEPNTKDPSVMREAPDVVFVPPSLENHVGRESVWQKLSNKIKALERNVSLSGGYLEELSVQYKKQIEDLQLAVRQSGEALAAASRARENDRGQVKDLQDQIGQLKLVVEEVSTRMETMSTWAVGVHALFLVVEIFVGILFVFACWHSRHLVARKMPEISNSKKVLVSSTPMKRRHSHDDKSSCLDEKRVQELNLSKRRRSLDLKKLNGHLGGSLDGLSKRQKKRLQRRLSRASITESSNDKLNNISRRSSESSDWKQVTAKSSTTNCHEGPLIELDNMFGLLNHSQHDDSLDKPAAALALNSQIRKRLFNGYLTHESSCTTSRSVTPERQNHSGSKVKKSSKKRSKSTSPLRKSVSKQKVMFQHFDPERVDWIQK